MAKKARTLLGALEDYDPNIRRLGMERLLSGKQLFDHRTKRLRNDIRDKIQARGILLWAQHYAQILDKTLVLRAGERRLLDNVLKRPLS